MMDLLYQDPAVQFICGDVLECLHTMPDGYAQTVITSPPYWGLRDYGMDAQLGLEETPDEYVQALVAVFQSVRRILKDDGTLWLNLGDSYAGSWGAQSRGDDYAGNLQGSSSVSARQITAHLKRTATGSLKRTPGMNNKNLIGIPWRVAFALQNDGWFLRSDIIWHKPNPMPESVTDRPTKAHEYLFLLSKSERYFYDQEAIREPAVGGWNGSSFVSQYDRATKPGLGVGDRQESAFRNKRSVWTVSTKPYRGSHFATFPPGLIEPCVLAGSRPGDLVIDPFSGSGTTCLVAKQLGRSSIGIELNPSYCQLAIERVAVIPVSLEVR